MKRSQRQKHRIDDGEAEEEVDHNSSSLRVGGEQKMALGGTNRNGGFAPAVAGISQPNAKDLDVNTIYINLGLH